MQNRRNLNNPNLQTKSLEVVERILSKNDLEAQKLRERFAEAGVYALNLMSSPGSGKTTLLEQMALLGGVTFSVIEGDLETNRDADRLRAKGVEAYQITTGEACHLEALMVAKALDQIPWQKKDFLIIENVGNLVCPASYDLGCAMNIVLLSVPEGDDKILKYPTMFLCADAVLITKSDMIDYFGFRLSQVREDLNRLGKAIPIFETSSKEPSTIQKFIQFIQEKKEQGYVSSHTF
ncbi:hydrogenase nickel incorporation protein HypB [Wolinella succinogenes]|uniref:HYDROGENASE PROTEIN B n=1 Tax=Wolinella succinogenes (strain ATCC 29543 / DSM 1740 / CCUG 13145 / JCM 31913 / LMG 7466 / NCTC 11488 / FDC 602W) TaxID=273121 RepID=Q7M9N7_WOLSU|nr:hydrogenase nickel incorporation protein HypB [Wolinella succinogenes]CAE09904.1 HYDROGENASE PROTEIN B [Wolinella succinogenes]VEG82118.1 Hydrogenase/urease nickel incorporation protein hypB [Wolinella succinogenes]HCZ18076.1 hydrogenase accessory protein HypB [Helicobacter sp.]